MTDMWALHGVTCEYGVICAAWQNYDAGLMLFVSREGAVTMPIVCVLCESPTYQELGGGMQSKHNGRKVWMSASSLSVKVQPKML